MTNFEIVGGGTCSLLETDGERVVLLATVASAPGATIAFRPSALDPASQAPFLEPELFKVKIRSCRRDSTREEPAFRIEGRFIDLSRAQRLTLLPRP